MKNIHKLRITLLFSLLSTVFLYGNSGKIIGTVTDDFGPLPGASIRMLQCVSDNEIRGVISDFDGHFVLSADLDQEVYLEISYMGYKTYHTQSIILTANSKEINLNNLLLVPEAQSLESVSVKGMKRAVTFSNGTTQVQIADNPMTQGESAFSLLNKLPGVSLGQNGEIMMNGKPGVKVMVNGQLIYMEGEELKTYLESLPSDAIANIELNTRPSASMDAEGGAGIMNINLKKSESKQLNGTVTAGYTYQNRSLWNGNIFINKQYEKWDWSVIADAAENSNTRRRFFETHYNSQSELEWLKQDGREVRKRRPIFLQFDSNYSLSSNQKTGINVQVGRKNSSRVWNSLTEVKEKDSDKIQHIKAYNNGDENFEYGLLSAYYRINTDTLGSNFKFTTDASVVSRDIATRFLNEFDLEETSLYKTPAENEYRIFATKADYQHVLKEGRKLKVGGKYSFTDFNSAMRYYSITDGVEEYRESLSNVFNYTENILAFYSEFSSGIGEKWKLDAGLRMEKTWGEGVEKILENRNTKNYVDWFPNVSLQQDVSPDYQIVYSYFKRITRPQYEFLNPQIFHIDPYNYIKGNPSLKSQKSHSIEVKNIFKQKYQAAFTFDYYTNFMGEVPILNMETHKNEYSIRNLDRALDVGINGYAPLQVTSFWNMTNSVSGNYQWYSLDLEETKRTNGHWFFMIQNQHQVRLPLDFQLGVNIMARSGFTMGYYTFNEQWGADMFLNKNLSNWNFNLKVADVFRSLKMKAHYEFSGNKSNSRQYAGNQFVSLQVKYRFGTGKKSGIEKQTDFEEFDRINK